MMLLLRIIRVALMAIFGNRLAPLDESIINLRVWPNDLDLNVHLNNGRYLSLMDLGRLDLAARTGIARAAIKGRWRPMVAAVTLRYRRPLPPFARYQLRTRLLGWDTKFFFMEQRFYLNQTLCAHAVVKGLFMGPQDKISPAQVTHAVGYDGPSPSLPSEVLAWLHWEQLAR
jgi:acyl-CoA thioesterase FadM